MLNKIKFLFFALKHCFYDKNTYCLKNAIITLNECKNEQLKIIMLNDNVDIEYYYCDCDDIAICVNKNNECIYVIDDFCETHCNMMFLK